jgi:hypothetical protein
MPHIERVNPRDDAGFVALVDSLAPMMDRPQDLQRVLRETHPRAVVRIRVLSGEPLQVWYVYRDGSWTNGSRGSRAP